MIPKVLYNCSLAYPATNTLYATAQPRQGTNTDLGLSSSNGLVHSKSR